MTTTFNRAAVKRRLGELLAYSLRDFDHGDDRPNGAVMDIPVVYTWDSAKVYPSSAFLGLLDGEAEPDGMRRNGGTSTDRYSVHIVIALTAFTDGALAEEAAEKALRAFDTVLRSSQRLINADVPAADEASFHGVSKTVIGIVSGPTHTLDQPGSNSVTGQLGFVVDCTTDIRP